MMNAHGIWRINWNFNLLIIHLNGSFNVEGTIELQKEIKRTVLKKNFS